MANSPFYAIPAEEASILSLLGSRPSYPNAEAFVDGLRETMRFCGDDWPRSGGAFLNYMKDMRPGLKQEHALLKMYFSVRTPDAEMSPEQELVEMRRFGRCSLPDALYLIGSLQKARGGAPLSFAMARQAGPGAVKPLWKTFPLSVSVKQFQRFRNDPNRDFSQQTPDELRYGFAELERSLKRFHSGDETRRISQGACHFLVSQSGIEQEDAEMFADILTSSMGLEAVFQRNRDERARLEEEERRRREAEAAEAERRRREAEAAEAERRRREAEAAEADWRRREAEQEEEERRRREAEEEQRRSIYENAAYANQAAPQYPPQQPYQPQAAPQYPPQQPYQPQAAPQYPPRQPYQPQQTSHPSRQRKKGGFLMPILVAVVLFFVLHGMFSQDGQPSASQQESEQSPQTERVFPGPPSNPAAPDSDTTGSAENPPPAAFDSDTAGAVEEVPGWTEARDAGAPDYDPEADITARLAYFVDRCDREYFDPSQFAGFDKDRCAYARNAIYAHSGRMFSENSSLRAYYSQFDWYRPSVSAKNFEDSMLNRYQTVNLYRLLSYETERGYRSEQYVRSYNRLKTFMDNCDAQTFSKSQLADFDKDMCMLARNAIYAKSGRKFNSEYLTAYFTECVSWYNPRINPDDFSDNLLNAYQKANRDLILEYEAEKGFR